MTELVPSIPTAWRLVLDTSEHQPRWMPLTEEDGIGTVAEDAPPATAETPDATVAVWVADRLRVTGTVLVAGARPGVWSVEITTS